MNHYLKGTLLGMAYVIAMGIILPVAFKLFDYYMHWLNGIDMCARATGHE